MVSCLNSLLDFDLITASRIQSLFLLAEKSKQKKLKPRNLGEVLALLFFEPSTRTRLSFETAALRAGIGHFYFDGKASSSLEKGETLSDCFLNIAAMKPSVIVVRSPSLFPLFDLKEKVSVPIINAGWGAHSHPTQALLDIFTLLQVGKFDIASLSQKKILIVGDLKHSRVAASHIQLSQKLGYKIGQCGPSPFLVQNQFVNSFTNLKEGLQWADVVMPLRFQFERHTNETSFSVEEFKSLYNLNSGNLSDLPPNSFIFHPGPVNYGIEIEPEVTTDPRCQILNQVEHGVYIREALLRTILGEE